MPELTGNPEWAVDVDDVHEWLAERADRVETQEMQWPPALLDRWRGQ